MSVHQLPNQLWIFWAKLWIFWASHLHTYKLLSVRKETPASCGLVFEVFVYDSIVLLKAFCSKFRPSSLHYRGPALRRSRLERWRESSKPHARITRPRTGKTHVLSKEVRTSVTALCFFFMMSCLWGAGLSPRWGKNGYTRRPVRRIFPATRPSSLTGTRDRVRTHATWVAIGK